MHLKSFFSEYGHVRALNNVTLPLYLIIENLNFQSLVNELITEILHKDYSMKIAYNSVALNNIKEPCATLFYKNLPNTKTFIHILNNRINKELNDLSLAYFNLSGHIHTRF